MKGTRTFVRVGKTPGIYKRDDTYYAGYSIEGKWTMAALDADNVTEAKKARESLLAGLREGRIAEKSGATFATVHEDAQGARRLSARTREHERHLLDRHLASLKDRRIQDVSSTDLGKILRGMRDTYSPWTQVAVFRLMSGTFSHALRRGLITRDPIVGLAPTEKPRQNNAREAVSLDADAIDQLVRAGGSERWQAALGLAGYAGLRLGELRGLKWEDIDFERSTIMVRRSLLPDGQEKETKTKAGTRVVPIIPALAVALKKWRLRSPRTADTDYVICTADGGHVHERNLRRALDQAMTKAKLTIPEGERLSWHALRHSHGWVLHSVRTPVATIAAVLGHTDPSFTMRAYVRDGREAAAIVDDVLARIAAAAAR